MDRIYDILRWRCMQMNRNNDGRLFGYALQNGVICVDSGAHQRNFVNRDFAIAAYPNLTIISAETENLLNPPAQ